MKPLHKYLTPLLATFALTAGTGLASDNFAESDLFIVFYQLTGPVPQVVSPDTYVFNLGPASLYRENTQNNVPVSTINSAIANSNIAADLAATFGEDWADSGTVSWGLVGGVTSNSSGTVNGDPVFTDYVSRARASFNTGATGSGTTINTLSSTNRGVFSNVLSQYFYGGVNLSISNGSATSGVNLAGTLIPITTTSSMEEFLPPTTTTFFGIGIDPRQRFNSGTLSGTAGLEGALDIYRFFTNGANVDLTAGASAGNAVAGTGQFIGTLTLDASGNLKIQGVGNAPPVANFSTWATANNVTGGVNGDSDNDSISNLMEYALALNPAGSDGTPGTFNGSTISFTKRAEAVTNNDVTYTIQESDDIGISDPWETVTPTTNTTTAITYTLPAGSPKKFARLIVNTVP